MMRPGEYRDRRFQKCSRYGAKGRMTGVDGFGVMTIMG